jgi:hypothetical protein
MRVNVQHSILHRLSSDQVEWIWWSVVCRSDLMSHRNLCAARDLGLR